MKSRYIIWAKWGAGLAFFSAADAALGTGAVQALADLCLSDSSTAAPMAPGMPMEHSRHALPLLIAGLGLSSVAFLGQCFNDFRASQSAWAKRRLPLLAGLASVATARGGVDAAEFSRIWNDRIDHKITEDDARIALGRFCTPRDTMGLMDNLSEKSDRADFICMSVTLLRHFGDPERRGISMLERLTARLDMSGLEIERHWNNATAPNHAVIAISGARNLGHMAWHMAWGEVLQTAARISPVLRTGARSGLGLLRRSGQAGLQGYIRLFASPTPLRGDDQLTALRQRFRRRSLRRAISQWNIPENMSFGQGFT